MEVPAGNYTLVLTPIEGEPTEPGAYLAIEPHRVGHRQHPGCGVNVRQWVSDPRSGVLWCPEEVRGSIWVYKVEVKS